MGPRPRLCTRCVLCPAARRGETAAATVPLAAQGEKFAPLCKTKFQSSGASSKGASLRRGRGAGRGAWGTQRACEGLPAGARRRRARGLEAHPTPRPPF